MTTIHNVEFQSLGRDSVCSSHNGASWRCCGGTVVFQSLGRDSVCSSMQRLTAPRYEFQVSISWARFCLFKRGSDRGYTASTACFNLLGEILFVQALLPQCAMALGCRFQSLGRDSVCSSRQEKKSLKQRGTVSISWARFCLFKPRPPHHR